MVVMWLTPFAWLHGVCNAPERLNIHILIVAEHLGGCVANQFKLVFVRGWDIFHERGEGVAAAVRRVFVALYAVFCLGWVIYAGRCQSAIERRSVGPQGHLCSICTAEHRAGVPASCEPVNNGLDLRGDGNSLISSGIGLGAADECILLPIIIAYIQLRQFGRPEAEIALGEHIVRVGHYAYILAQFVQLLDGDTVLAAALASPHNEILPHIDGGKVARDAELI